MAEVVYVLCALTSTVCAILLLRSYVRSRTRLLLWSSLCFVGLALNNSLHFIDPIDLSTPRNLTALVALMLLIFGLVWDSK